MKMSWRVLTLVALAAVAAGACSSDTKGGADAAAGSSGGGASGSAGTSGRAGTTGGGGTTGSAGTTGRGGTTGRAGATGAGGTGTQPVGAACVNNGMCSQADGPAVCCLSITTCVLDGQCPGSTNYIPCSDTMPCTKAGWICCNAGVMSYCTKQSGCLAP